MNYAYLRYWKTTCLGMMNNLGLKANIRLISAFLQSRVCRNNMHNSTARYLRIFGCI